MEAQMADAVDYPTAEVVTAVLTASRVLVAVSARSLAEVEDKLTLAQFRVLVVLENRRRINLNGLADALGVTASTALRTVDRLVASRLAERRENPNNRREVLLSVTATGAKLVEDVTARRSGEIAEILARMSARKRTDLVAAFRSFAEAADEPTPEPRELAMLGW
jgi:DNA-binding MarR family transcriptional regulator